MGVVEKRCRDYVLTTAEIVYRLPDAEYRLQTFIWQNYDQAPDFPALHKFLDSWRRNLDGKVHSVRVGHAPLAKPSGGPGAGSGWAVH